MPATKRIQPRINMSAESTRITTDHFQYIAARTIPEDAFLRDLNAAAAAAEIPPIRISAEQAALMRILLTAANTKTVVEVGTLAGYSAINMARALPADGHVHTIEALSKHADFARDWIARSDVADRITVHEGKGADVLRTLPADSADAAFLDADKPKYPLYLDECLRIVRTGGLIMADNAFAFGQLFDENPTDPEAPAMKAFNDKIAADPRLDAVIIPIGDGLWIGVKK